MNKKNNAPKELKENENVKSSNVGKRKFNFVNFLDTYFAIPIILFTCFIWLGEIYKTTLFGNILNGVLGFVFFVWLILGIYRICKKLIKLSLIWPLAVSLGCFISSYICGYVNAVKESNILFIVAAILLEIYFLYVNVCNVYSKKIAIGNLITLSLAFLTLGYITIYYASFDSTDPTLFNSLIAVFSAIVGGGLTLGGVAWTIKHEKEEKRKEERDKAKPVFDYSVIFEEPTVISGSKNCFPNDFEKEYSFDVHFSIENSNKSVMKMKRVFHDSKWFDLTGNTTVLPDKSVILSFRVNDPLCIFLEIEDALFNLYYYKIKILNTGLLNGNPIRHTIRGMKEVLKEDMEKEISNTNRN